MVDRHVKQPICDKSEAPSVNQQSSVIAHISGKFGKTWMFRKFFPEHFEQIRHRDVML